MKVMKKGQVVFEFIIAALIVFSIIFYSINFISGDFGLRHNRFMSDRLESNALRVSDMLLSNHQNGIIGTWPRLDAVKMAAFDAECDANYIDMLPKLGLKEGAPYVNYIQMNIQVADSSSYVTCGRTPPDEIGKATVTRYAVSPSPSNEISTIVVTLW